MLRPDALVAIELNVDVDDGQSCAYGGDARWHVGRGRLVDKETGVDARWAVSARLVLTLWLRWEICLNPPDERGAHGMVDVLERALETHRRRCRGFLMSVPRQAGPRRIASSSKWWDSGDSTMARDV